jgi:hypothetical protein
MVMASAVHTTSIVTDRCENVTEALRNEAQQIVDLSSVVNSMMAFSWSLDRPSVEVAGAKVLVGQVGYLENGSSGYSAWTILLTGHWEEPTRK